MLEIGRIKGAHGLRGDLTLVPHWAGTDAFGSLGHLTLVQGSKSERFELVSVRPAGKGLIVHLGGLDERDSAESWHGASVLAERAELPPLEPGAYYLNDLIGAEVSAPDGLVGRVIRIALHPSVDALVIETPDGRVVEQPLIDHWLGVVNAEQGSIELVSRDGLVE
ncbi:MAG TPA: ribosome maturation factor RimM [Polyangiaceae bacterium]|jgi:16S rRNA processing protein RimM|nr:ribosome maturation factor RimM [Polyangiaceae bacterium]